MNKVKRLFRARWMSSLIFLILLFLITGIADPAFLNYSNIISCFNTATMYTLLAVGIAFVIMTGEIDVSIGSTLGLTAAMTGLIAQQGGSVVTMLLVCVAAGAFIGLCNGLGVAYFGVPSLIFTLGTNSVVRGMIYILTDGRTVENFGGAISSYGNKTLLAGITVYYAIAVALVAVSHLVLTKTRKGKYFIAVGDNAGGANLVGMAVLGTEILAYVLCGIVGLLVSPLMCLVTIAINLVVHNIVVNVISPRLMKTTVNVHPAVTLIAILIGEGLCGVLGMLLAVPVVAALQTIFVTYFETRTGKSLYTEDGALFQKVTEKPVPQPLQDVARGIHKHTRGE